MYWNSFAVHALQVEIGELKGRLTEVISNCDALCKRITVEGPESLRTSIKPFTVDKTDRGALPNPSTLQTSLVRNPPSEE